MKIISKNKDDTRREVIIDGETKHIHKKNGKWWMRVPKGWQEIRPGGVTTKLVPVPAKEKKRQ